MLCRGILSDTLSTCKCTRHSRVKICTAEKQMERRTGCLQGNVEFLRQALTKLTRETQDKIATAERDLAAAQAEITELKSTVAKLNTELKQIQVNAETSK
jgi:hypothetical protein